MANQNRIMIINIFDPYFCGQLDVPLTDTGTKSADDLCDYFKEKQIKHVYVSDY
ncbi:histidine phosphatase family protein [Staphylococcus aureus]